MFTSPFTSPMVGKRADVDWYLSGGISAANCIAAYQPIGAASQNVSYADLTGNGNTAYNKNASHDCLWASDTGWEFRRNSDTGWITTELGTGVNITTAHSCIIRFSDATIMNYQDLLNVDDKYRIETHGTTQWAIYINNRQVSTVSQTSSGVIGIANRYLFFNGSVITSQSSGTMLNSEFIIGDEPILRDGGRIQAMAIYDIDITSYISALTTAMNLL